MKIYLARHGEALPKETDPRQPLSDRGREQASGVAKLLGRAGARAARTRHSGKPRAEETARLLAGALVPGEPAQALDGLAPNDPVEPVAAWIEAASDDLLVVGHLPFMSRLAAHLLTGDANGLSVAFAPAAVLCLERDGAGRWALAWLVGPDLAGP